MKMYLISDNVDTQTGMRLAGVEGVVVHERFDGKGYPAGLKGGQLPEMVWIISVADALDAMGSDRCYRGHCDRDYIIGEFRKLSGTQFEPAAVKALVELLESGEIAVP